MAITYPNKSWLRFPSATDVSWNDLADFCNGEQWCYPVDDNVLSRFQLQVGEGGELISNGDFSTPLHSGTVTAHTVNKLRDGGATFNTSDLIVVGMTAQNVTDDTTATVTIIDSDIQLSLDADIFPAPDLDDYEISGWVEGTGWRVNPSGNPGLAEATAGSASDLEWGQAILVQDRTYKVTFTIDDYTAGTVTPVCGGTSGTARSAIGTYTEYIQCGADGVFKFSKNAAGEMDLSSVSVVEVDEIFIVVRPDGGGNIESILEIDTDYFYDESAVRAQVNWSAMGLTTNTCWELCTYDVSANEVLADPSFKNVSNSFGLDWTVPSIINASVSFNDGVMEYAASGSPNNGTVRSAPPLVVGTQYIVRYKISSITDAQVQIQCGSGDVVGAISATTGIKQEIHTCSGSTNLDIVITGTSAGADVDIDWISVVEVGDTDRCSECFFYKAEHSDTLIFNYYNDEDAFGMEYEQSASLQNEVMLWARIGKETFPEEMESHLDSAGAQSVLYGQSRERRELIYGDMPRYVHRAMAAAWLHDRINIFEGATFLAYTKVPGDWQPAWEDFRNVAPAIIEVEAASQDENTNTNC